uniref:Ras-related protein RHN1 n=1 Tax=Vitis vinifera TaxID=29760 RepID=A5B8V4_VITVI|nr:hypothetical protein VITISV_044046 [Vitis vinifera]
MARPSNKNIQAKLVDRCNTPLEIVNAVYHIKTNYMLLWHSHTMVQVLRVLVGDMGTGKTSLVLRFVKGQFFEHQEPTIGAAFFTQLLSLNEATVKFDIWDTAGQERYHSLAPMYYRGAAAAVVVYDISNVVVICSTSYSCIWLFTSLGADSLRLMLL